MTVAATFTVTLAMTAKAASIETGNPNFGIRWDNTIRYNLGVRASSCDVNICGNGAGAGDVSAHQSDRKFGKAGDVVTSRFDLLSEIDLVYKENFGFRVSAAGWYDPAYTNRIKGDPALSQAPGNAGQGAGPTGSEYASYTKRYAIGPSGELLDAFVFAKHDFGDIPVSVKLGKHNIYWGESLFSFVGGVAYNQSSVDFRKALANPGIEAKEVFRPLSQLSASAQVTPTLTLMGQYLLDWEPTLLPDGGTYFGAADGLSLGGTGSIFGAPTAISDKPRKHGDFGLAAKWRPEWADASLGFYYREFTNKFPQLVLNSFVVIPGVGAAPTGFGLNYASAKREKLFGFSLGKEVAGTSLGLDVTYRPDSVLQARPFAVYAPPGTAPASFVPTGNVTTVVANAIKLLGKTPMFDLAPLIVEVNYSRLGSVTANAANYDGQGYACAVSSDPTMHGCPTKDAWAMAASFEPKWFQVWSGVDLTLPMSYSIGLKGNSPVIFGDNKGQGNWSIGVGADVQSTYAFSLKYNGFNARHANDQAGATSDNNSALGKYWDRGWVSLTAKASF